MVDFDRVTRQVKVTVGGREYALAFTLSGLQELEKYFGNLNTAFSKDKIPTVTALSAAFWIGLKGAGMRIDRTDSEPIVAAFCREYGMAKLTELFFIVLAASGFLGKEASDQILEGFGLTDTKAKEEDTKNVLEAKQ